MSAQMVAAQAAQQGGATMKAIVQEGSGSADVLHVRDIPRPVLTDDRILVRVRAASVNALDWHSVHGGFLLTVISKFMRQPAYDVRGVDLAGVVEAVGANVSAFRPGDEVFGGGPGALAEYALASERGLAPLPRGITFEEAAAVGVAGRTALQGLRDHGQVKPGQRVLVYGAGGGVGSFAVQIAKALGAHVTAVTSTRNLELIGSLGPDEIVDYTKEDVTRRRGRYDVVYDVAANRSLGAMRRLLAPNGILVMAGAAKSGGMIGIFARILGQLIRSRVFGQRVVMYVAKASPSDLTFLKDLMESGKLRPLIDRTYPFEKSAEAIAYLGRGEARAKVVITVP